MMKKLLILMLVLGMASVANALTVNLSLDGMNPAPDAIDVNPGDVIYLSTISDTSGDIGNYFQYLEMDLPSAGTISDVAMITANVGSLAGIADFSSGILVDIELTAMGAPGNYPVAGQHFTFTLTIAAGAATDGSDNFDLWTTLPNDDINYAVDDLLGVNIIPEPMTIALLGLGSLFLLRRRK